jgi:uncharacterized protein YxeA
MLIIIIIIIITTIILYKIKSEETFELIENDRNMKIKEMEKTMGNKFGKYEQYNKVGMFKKGMFIIPNKWGVRSFNEEKWN